MLIKTAPCTRPAHLIFLFLYSSKKRSRGCFVLVFYSRSLPFRTSWRRTRNWSRRTASTLPRISTRTTWPSSVAPTNSTMQHMRVFPVKQKHFSLQRVDTSHSIAPVIWQTNRNRTLVKVLHKKRNNKYKFENILHSHISNAELFSASIL